MRTPLLVGVLLTLAACDQRVSVPILSRAPITYTETRERCGDATPLKRAYYGDLHAHTGFSFDARSYGNVLTPADAYRFARGESVKLAPLDLLQTPFEGTRTVRLQRPLDFVGVSDHSEFLGEIYRCTTPGAPGYDSVTCTEYRDPQGSGAFQFGFLLSLYDGQRFADICGEDGNGCVEDTKRRWQAMRDAAESAYDRTANCKFTSFVAYEYTNTLGVSNLHRNVVFRNANVPELPVSLFEARSPLALWTQLEQRCLKDTPGCDVLVIPHNSNLSNGQLFVPNYPEATTLEEQRRIAALRQKMEPLVEIFQHKGDSECKNGLSGVNGDADPLCDFEKLRSVPFEDCGDEPGSGGMRLWGCVHRLDFVRNVLKIGLEEHARLGVNVYQLGIIGSTDTHNGTPGMVESIGFPGHVGIVDDTPEKRLGAGNVTHDALINNPGGLAAVWAEENSRDAIFSALRNRETFATSGPRIKLRFFGGWRYPTTLCGRDDFVLRGYSDGVPMGQQLPTAPDNTAAPIFAIRAEWDAGTSEQPGTALQQLQVIKGWRDADGTLREKVYLVDGNPNNGATVDIKTCATSGDGAKTLCAIWQDPDFSPSRRAFYYARVVENPTCRWSTRQCNAFGEGSRPEGCASMAIQPVVQQRAWSSPIWYLP